RKHAYRYLLYWAMLDIRALQGLGRGWRSWSPLHWRREARRAQCAGAVANWLHNLALHSSVGFQRFNEEWFWRGYEAVRARVPEFGLESYREMFERHASPPEDSHDAESP